MKGVAVALPYNDLEKLYAHYWRWRGLMRSPRWG